MLLGAKIGWEGRKGSPPQTGQNAPLQSLNYLDFSVLVFPLELFLIEFLYSTEFSSPLLKSW